MFVLRFQSLWPESSHQCMIYMTHDETAGSNTSNVASSDSWQVSSWVVNFLITCLNYCCDSKYSSKWVLGQMK